MTYFKVKDGYEICGFKVEDNYMDLQKKIAEQ